MFKKKLIFGLLLTATFLLAQQNTIACSCGPIWTVLDEFQMSELTITAKAVSFIKNNKNDVYFRNNITAVKMVVEKVYKGNVKVGDEILIGQDNDSGVWCAWSFEETVIGKEFLFYLDDRKMKLDKNSRPIYYVSFCGKSTSLDQATGDLLFLDNLSKLHGKTRISGRIKCYNKLCPSAVNIEVKFTGEGKTFTTRTDKNGKRFGDNRL